MAKLQVQVKHLYREGNSAIDWLAKDALVRRVTQEIRLEDIPIPVRRLAYIDKHGIPYIRKSK